jgi:hypothetical protein
LPLTDLLLFVRARDQRITGVAHQAPQAAREQLIAVIGDELTPRSGLARRTMFLHAEDLACLDPTIAP